MSPEIGLPVALVLLGTGLDRFSVAFMGWFGPRGLASVIFALLALEGLDEAGQEIVAIISVTVLASVILHGFSADPLANRCKAPAPAEFSTGQWTMSSRRVNEHVLDSGVSERCGAGGLGRASALDCSDATRLRNIARPLHHPRAAGRGWNG